jgi:hypothetical protein
MPFRFDRTPLGAVESLARRAGQVQAENTAFSQNLALRQLSNQEQTQAYARESDAQDRIHRDNAFKLQVAAAARDEERVKIAQDRADQQVLTEERRYKDTTKRTDLQMQRDEDRYQMAVRKQNEVERAGGARETNAQARLGIAQQNADSFAMRSTYTDELKKLGDTINNAREVMKGGGKNFEFIDGKWYDQARWYGGRSVVTDATHIAELNAAKQALDVATKRQDEVAQRIAQTTAPLPTRVASPMTAQLNDIFNNLGRAEQGIISQAREQGYSDEKILAAYLKP